MRAFIGALELWYRGRLHEMLVRSISVASLHFEVQLRKQHQLQGMAPVEECRFGIRGLITSTRCALLGSALRWPCALLHCALSNHGLASHTKCLLARRGEGFAIATRGNQFGTALLFCWIARHHDIIWNRLQYHVQSFHGNTQCQFCICLVGRRLVLLGLIYIFVAGLANHTQYVWLGAIPLLSKG